MAPMTTPTPVATLTRTFEIKLAGRTEAVEFTGNSWNERPVTVLHSAHGVFAARIGFGEKLYAASATAWLFESVEVARSKGYRPSQIVTDSEGLVWGIKLADTIRNRQAVITHWAEDYRGTSVAAAYDDYSGLGGTKS
jgi:hypothetical protein